MNVQEYLGSMGTARPHRAPQIDDAIEDGGIRWDPRTGCQVGVVFVIHRSNYTRPSFSRYSRRSRFFSRLLDYVTSNHMVSRIMLVFDDILEKWKTKRHEYSRVYFLNVRCLLFLITKHLEFPAQFPKKECLRDMKRFQQQETMFNDFV